jgi:Ca-activated chloride channel family protein
MSTLANLEVLIRGLVAEWQALPMDALQFWHRDVARLALLGLVSIAALLLALRMVSWTGATGASGAARARRGVALPALPTRFATPGFAWLRHSPLLLFAAGLPLALLALADPYSALVQENASYPGRRISLMIDASTSMSTTFKTESLKTRSPNGPAFYTTVAAAEQFVQLRLKGQHKDLMALVEFGNQAYVITPFTSDYDNILLSIALISDPVEFSLFPDRGTIIAHAVDQSIDLFKAFDFLDASGNLMVIFTDGEDTRAEYEGVSLDEILQGAIDNGVPLYFVRTNYQKALGDIIPDALWKKAVEKTGGKFYAASDEASLMRAIRDIDRLAAGTIQVKRYTTQEPRFGVFALFATGLWSAAAAVKLASGRFQSLP